MRYWIWIVMATIPLTLMVGLRLWIRGNGPRRVRAYTMVSAFKGDRDIPYINSCEVAGREGILKDRLETQIPGNELMTSTITCTFTLAHMSHATGT